MEPIYLYVKTHNITGLKYFGKTTKPDPISYVGSGLYWKRHLSKYGKDFSTEIIGEFYDEDECSKVALEFSRNNNIVESDEWANLIYENGLDGAPKGNVISDETKDKIRKSLTGKPSPKSKYIIKEDPEIRSSRISSYFSGKRWITNGQTIKLIDEGDVLPEGFVYGRILRQEKEPAEYRSRSEIMKTVWSNPKRKELHQKQMEERIASGFYDKHKGIKRSESFCTECSKRMIENNPMKNPTFRENLKKSLSKEETVSKKRENMRGNTFVRGRKWFNNGEINKMFYSAPDETWVYGRLIKKEMN